MQTVETALKDSRKDLTATFHETKCEEQEILEITISIEMPLLPKVLLRSTQTSETIHVPLLKTLKEGEVLHSKLADIKKKILSTNEALEGYKKEFKGRYMVTKKEVSYSAASKEDLVALTVPAGTYLFTVSGFITTNASNYMAMGITKAEICPGTCTYDLTQTSRPPTRPKTLRWPTTCGSSWK